MSRSGEKSREEMESLESLEDGGQGVGLVLELQVHTAGHMFASST